MDAERLRFCSGYLGEAFLSVLVSAQYTSKFKLDKRLGTFGTISTVLFSILFVSREISVKHIVQSGLPAENRDDMLTRIVIRAWA